MADISNDCETCTMSVTNKNFLYLSNNQMKCLSLSWCKFVIDLVMFVTDLVYVCHWLYTGRQKKLLSPNYPSDCRRFGFLLTYPNTSCTFTSKCMLTKGCSSFVLYLILQKCVEESKFKKLDTFQIGVS